MGIEKNKNLISQHKRMAMGMPVKGYGKNADEEIKEKNKGQAEEKAEANK